MIDAQRKYGTRLEKLAEASGATVELGRVASIWEGEEQRVLLVSGTFEEVSKTNDRIHTLPNKRIASSGPDLLDATTPVHSIGLWKFAMRQNTAESGIMETVMPEETWQLFVKNIGKDELERRTGAKMEIGNTFEQVSQYSRGESLAVRSLLIFGTHAQIRSARALINRRRRDPLTSTAAGHNFGSQGEVETLPGTSAAPLDTGSQGVGKETPDAVADEVRMVLRTLTHPVVLITTKQPSETGIASCRGVTVSSFGTVTLRPDPIFSFNLKVPSRTWDALKGSRRLCVHVLAASRTGAAIAHAFTQGHHDPAHAFRRLEQLGVAIYMSRRRPQRPPSFRPGDDVLATMDGDVIIHKCVEIGDHVIVLARIDRVTYRIGTQEGEGREHAKTLENGVGLGYARQQYRTMGESVNVTELPVLQSAEAAANERVVRADVAAVGIGGKGAVEGPPSTRKPVSEPEPTPIRETDFTSEGAENELFRAMEEVVIDEEEYPDSEPKDSGRRTAWEEEDDYPKPSPEHRELVDKVQQRPSGSTLRPSQPKFWPFGAPVRAPVRPSSKDALGKPSFSRHFTSPAQPISISRYSTSSSLGGSASGSAADSSSSSSADDRHVTDPSLLKSTVAEFFGLLEDEPITRPRMAELVRLRRASEIASERLSEAMAAGTLTEEMSLSHEQTITTNERKIARSLALQSADDLRRMLDRGKVDVRRAQWLESSIEKGQVAIVEEARQVRQMFDQGAFNEERFQMFKERLGREHGVLNTEAMRLRQMYDDDEDFGVAVAAEPQLDEAQQDHDRTPR